MYPISVPYFLPPISCRAVYISSESEKDTSWTTLFPIRDHNRVFTMEFLPLVILGVLVPVGLLFWAYSMVKLLSKEKTTNTANAKEKNKK